MRTIFACLALLCVVNCGGQVPPGGNDVSTPMFIREPVLYSKYVTSTDGYLEVVPTVAEATMIEEVRYLVNIDNTLEGRITFRLSDGVTTCLVAGAVVAASGATSAAGGTITMNLTLPVGWSMDVSTSIIVAVPGDAVVSIAALGGILR